MTKSKFEQNGGTYRKVGDYYIPNITVPPEEKDIRIGIWGMRYKNYLKENKRVTFTIMQMNGTLWQHLADIDKQAEEMLISLLRIWQKPKE